METHNFVVKFKILEFHFFFGSDPRICQNKKTRQLQNFLHMKLLHFH